MTTQSNRTSGLLLPTMVAGVLGAAFLVGAIVLAGPTDADASQPIPAQHTILR